MKRVRIGLLGCGTVGGGVVRLIGEERERIRVRFAVDLAVMRILVRDLTKERPGVRRDLLTSAAADVLESDDLDLDEQNAVVIRGRAAGEIVLSGKGAGAMPTATAILGDVISASCLT